MAEYIFIFSISTVFLIRDVQLLTAKGVWTLNGRLAAYVLLQAAALGTLCFVGGAQANAGVIHLLRSPAVWAISLILHAAVFCLCLAIRRNGFHANAWMVALIPSPMLLICQLSLAGMRAAEGACLPVSLAWTALVCGVAWVSRRPPECDEFSFVIEFAGFSSATMLAAIPVIAIPG